MVDLPRERACRRAREPNMSTGGTVRNLLRAEDLQWCRHIQHSPGEELCPCVARRRAGVCELPSLWRDRDAPRRWSYATRGDVDEGSTLDNRRKLAGNLLRLAHPDVERMRDRRARRAPDRAADSRHASLVDARVRVDRYRSGREVIELERVVPSLEPAILVRLRTVSGRWPFSAAIDAFSSVGPTITLHLEDACEGSSP